MAFSLERLGLGMDIRRLKVCLSVLFLKSFERRPCCRGVDLNGDGLGQLTLGVCRWFVSTSEQSLNSYAAKASDVPTKMILTADEKRMCANAGITEKDWLKYKLEELKGEK